MAGGIDWFRWHHGSVTDPKFQLVARKSKQALASVIAVWAFVLEQASASEDRGVFGTIDCEAIDCLLGLDDGATEAILVAMGERGLLADGSVSSWEKRQPKRERIDSGSTERSRAFRERQRQAEKEGDEQRQETPESADATPRNATQRQETPIGEERREEPPTGVQGVAEAPPRRPQSGGSAAAIEIPPWMPVRQWEDFVSMRRAKGKRAPFTVAAAKGIVAELGKLREQGHDAADVLNQSLINGWSGVFAIKSPGRAVAPANGAIGVFV